MVTFPFIDWTDGALRQTVAATIVCFSQVWVGGGFVSVFGMPGVSNETFGWLVCCSQMAELIVIMPGVWMSSLLGKKTVLQLAAVPAIAAYTLLSQADHIVDLFTARILQGISSGIISGVLPLYLTDISTEKIRGGLNHIQISCWYIGVAVIYSTAPFISILPVTIILLILTLVWSLMMCWVPESPWYFFDRGRESKALDSLTWLRGDQGIARREYDTTVSDRIQASWRELISKQTLVITVIGILHWAFVPAWMAYSYKRLYFLTEDEGLSKGIQLGQAILCFLFSVCSSCLLASSTRRLVLIRSLIVAVLTALAPSAYLYYFSRFCSSAYVYITPAITALILLYPILSSLTFHPLMYTFSLEIFYKDKQTKVSIYLAHLSAILTSLSCALVPALMNMNNEFVNFSLLTVTAFISLIFIFICLPETKNKHIFEINRLFRS